MNVSELNIGDRYRIVTGTKVETFVLSELSPPCPSFRDRSVEPAYDGAGWRVTVTTETGEKKKFVGTKRFVEKVTAKKQTPYEGVSYVCPYCVEETSDPSHAWWCLTAMTERSEQEKLSGKDDY